MTEFAYALPPAEGMQIVAEPDYIIPNQPICEMSYSPAATQFSLWAPSAGRNSKCSRTFSAVPK